MKKTKFSGTMKRFLILLFFIELINPNIGKAQSPTSIPTSYNLVTNGNQYISSISLPDSNNWFKWTTDSAVVSINLKMLAATGRYTIKQAKLYHEVSGHIEILDQQDLNTYDSTFFLLEQHLIPGEKLFLNITTYVGCSGCSVIPPSASISFALLQDYSRSVSTTTCQLVSDPGMECFSVPCNSLVSSNPWAPCTWLRPNSPTAVGTSDYFNSCAVTHSACGTCYVNSNTNFVSMCQTVGTHSGSGYLGAYLYSPSVPDYREYLVNKLVEPMVPGKIYFISMFVRLANISKWGLQNIDMLLGNNLPVQSVVNGSSSTISTTSGQFINTLTHNTVITDKTGWTQLTATVSPTSTYNYITIGNFNNDAATTSTVNLHQSGWTYGTPNSMGSNCTDHGEVSYYYFDDVSITPLDINAGPDKSICLGNSTTLTGSLTCMPPGATITTVWTPSITLTSPTSLTTTATPTVSTNYTLTATVIYTTAAGTSTVVLTDQAFVSVTNNNFTLTANGNPNPICLYPGSTSTLTTNGGSNLTYTWTSASGSTVTTSPIVTPSVTTTYTVSTINCAQTKTAVVTVTVNASPAFTVVPQPACLGSSVTVSTNSTTTINYINFGEATSLSNVVNPHVYAAAGNYSITIDAYNTSGSCNTHSVIPIVVATPGLYSMTYTAQPCSYNYTFTQTYGCTSSGADYSFEVIGSGGTFSVTPGTITTNTYTVQFTSPGTYTVIGWTSVNSFASPVTITLQVAPVTSPSLSIASSASTVCAGSPVTFTVTGAAGLTYTWSPCPVNCSGTIIAFNPTVTTVYTVTAASACGISTATKTITVNSKPTISISAQPNPLCAGSTATITASGASTYTWYPMASTGASITISPSVTTVYTVNATGANSCTNSVGFTETVVVNPVPGSFNIITPTSPVIANGTGTNVISLSSTISNTTGLVFNWQPGGATTPTTSFNLTQPEVISLTVSNSVCSTSKTQSICINYVSQTCTMTGVPTLSNTVLTSTTQISASATYSVVGTLTINVSGAFDVFYKTLVMATGAKIVVVPTCTLNLQGTNIYSCDGMWQGIELQDNGIRAAALNFTDNGRIEDAYMAISAGTSTVSLNHNIYVTGSNIVFNKNYIDINILNGVSGTIYPLSFASLGMYSESSLTSPGANLKCSGYYSPSVKARSYAGLYAENAAIINFTANVTGAHPQIKNKDYGLYFKNTDALVYYTSFDDFVGSKTTTCDFSGCTTTYVGVGIRSENSNYLKVKPVTTPSVGGMVFNNMACGILTNNTATVDVQSGEFYNPSQYNTNVGTKGIGLNSIVINDATELIRINLNKIEKSIAAVSANFTSAPSSSFSLSISQNTLTASTGTITNAIAVQSSVSYSPATSSMRINGNTITDADIGIYLTNLKNGLRVSANTVGIRYAASGAKQGIRLNGCSNITIDNNTISSTNTANANLRGVYLQLSPGCKTQCNTVSTVGQSFVFEGNCLSTTDGFINNIMNGAKDGMVLRLNGIIGTQGATGGGTPGSSGNQWLGTFSNSKTLVSDVGSSAQNSNLVVKNNTNEYPQPQTLNARAGTAAPTVDNYGTSVFNFPASIFTVTTNNYSCLSAQTTGLKMQQPDSKTMSYEQAMQDSALYQLINGPGEDALITEETREINRRYVYNVLDAGYATNHAGLVAFYNEQSDSIVAHYNVVDSLLEAKNYSAAQSQNNQIINNSQIQYNQQLVNNALIKYGVNQQNAFTQNDLDELMALANTCPLQQGTAVYQARTLLNVILNSVLEFDDNCEFESNSNERLHSSQIDSQSNDFTLYPNPNNGIMYLKYRIDKDANITVYDMSGRILYEHYLNSNNTILQIQTTLSPGIYFYTIKDKTDKILKTDKLIIMK